jgi:hypothetical protein
MIPVKKTIKASLMFWLSLLLLVALPLVAAAAPVPEPEVPPEQIEEGEVEPQWVPSGSHPGFYAARDNRNLDPTEYALAGSQQSFYWDRLEPTEGNYDWSGIQAFINQATASGKRVSLQIITFNGRANQYNASDPPIRVPSWVFSAGAGKVTTSDGFQIPKYWDPVYKAKYRNFVTALGNQFDGNAAIEYINLGVGKFGETQPCDDKDDSAVKDALVADGWSQWTWPYIVNDIVDMYADAFDTTRLVLACAPTFYSEGDRKSWMDHAVSKGVGLFPAGVYADLEWVDLRTHGTLSGAGKYDLILNQAGTDNTWVPVSFEMYNYMTSTPTKFFWAVAGTLSRRVDYITLERDVLYVGEPDDPVVTPLTENIATMRWAGKYMGKKMSNTPSVWVLLRESGNKSSVYPQRGNYSFGLLQDDGASQGRTKATTYRSTADLPREGLDATYANADIETGVTELSYGRSGYDAGMPPWEGWICRRTDSGSGNPNMVFKVDDRYINGGTNEVTLSVIYFDKGTDSWRLVYDATSDANKVAGTVTKENTNRWRKKVFSLTDARFANSQSDSADFRIESMGDGNEYIQMVDVKKGGASQDSFSVNLTTNRGGWNLVSVPLVPASTSIASFLSSISGQYDLVQAYYGGAWHNYPSGDLATVDQKMGLWIHVTTNCTLTVEGTAPTSTTIALSSSGDGWNLIGWPASGARSISTALSGILGKYDRIYAYEATDATDPWKIYDVSAPGYVNDLTQFSPGKGYWIHMTSSADLVVSY